MKALVLERTKSKLVLKEVATPPLKAHEVLLRVAACGICRTDLHIIDGDLHHPKLPLILGHEVIGAVTQVGSLVTGLNVGDRVGVPWLHETCGTCEFCRLGQQNLCDAARFTGYDVDGGFAEFMKARSDVCYTLPSNYSTTEAAPLMCAGIIGYRAYSMIRDNAQRIGIYGFGAAAHIIAQVAVVKGKEVYAFTRPGDVATQKFAKSLGVVYAGASDVKAAHKLDAALIFAPVGALVPVALSNVRKGGVVVCAGIHMSDIPSFSYDLLWGERSIRSVANLTRLDVVTFLELAGKLPLKTHVTTFALSDANNAIDKLRNGEIQGAAVLVPG